MIKYILQPEKYKFVASFLAIFLSFGILNPIRSTEKSKIDLDDLLFYERIIIDYYLEGKSRETSIRDLDTRCRWRDLGRGLSCANLAILYKNIGDLPRAYTAAAMAYKKEPRNSYYRNLFQNIAVLSGNIRDMERRMGREGRIVVRYSRAIQECNQGNPSRALSDVIVLVNEKHITKEQFDRGIFFHCFKNDRELLQDLRNQAISNEVNYVNLLREEEDRLNPFREIWDLNFYRKDLEGNLTDKDIPESELTKNWLDVKLAIQERNLSKAKNSYRLLKETLDAWKKKSDKDKLIAESLELAIEITLTQNPDFKMPGLLSE